MREGRVIGVLGGMGPLATAEFFRRVVELTEAASDQDHLPLLIRNVPQIPDRTAAILGQGPSPLPALQKGIEFLEAAGADCIAIPCNTAHYWYSELQKNCSVEILHIVDATADKISRASDHRRVGLLATPGTIRSGIYQHRLENRGFEVLLPNEEALELVHRGIYQIKAGSIQHARLIFAEVTSRLLGRGAQHIILGCTEIGLAFDSSPSAVDSTTALAEAVVRRYRPSLAENRHAA